MLTIRRCLAALTAATFLVLPMAAHGAVEGIGVSPTNQEIELTPGGTKSGSLTVINDGTSDITYKMSVADYHVNDESYKADFTTLGAGPDVSAVSWFALSKQPAVLKAGQQVQVPYVITVPKSAAIGGHYIGLFAETAPKVTPGSGIARIQKLGSLFYLNVAGAVTKQGSIDSFKAAWLQPGSPLSATLRVKNGGNVHFAASGEAHITDLFGKEISKGVFKGEVLPSTTRRFNLALPVKSPVGVYKFSVTPHYLDANGPVMSRWVIVIPTLTLIIILLTVGVVTALYVTLLWRRLRARQ